ncbi:hypothetical protein ABW21_db0206744 [Orbilia brochopaga]|nr:hypothetical protein ABW21_db0206744 [Drechslerella brochopaga]
MSSQTPPKSPRGSRFNRFTSRFRSKSASPRRDRPKSNRAVHTLLAAVPSTLITALGLRVPDGTKIISNAASATAVNQADAVTPANTINLADPVIRQGPSSSVIAASQPSTVPKSASPTPSLAAVASSAPAPPNTTISQPPDTTDPSTRSQSQTGTSSPNISTITTSPSPTSAANASSTAIVIAATAPATTASVKPKAPDLWARAFENLSDDEQNFLGQVKSSNETCTDQVEHLIKEIEGIREKSLEKAWKITWRNEKIILRDIAEKAVQWVQKFVIVGDIAMQCDPIHSALPWAAVRFVLKVAISDFENTAAILIGIDKVNSIIGRFTAYEKMYMGLGLEYEETLKKGLITFYSSVLQFLIKSKRFFETSPIGKRIATGSLQ